MSQFGKLRIFLIAASALPLVTPARGATVYSQPSDYPTWHTSGYFRISMIDASQVLNPDVATAFDDFTLSQPASITGITWRGAYYYPGSPPPPPPVQGTAVGFVVTLYSATNDAAAYPDLASVLNQTIVDGPAGEAIVTKDAIMLLCDYSVTLTTPFSANAGTKYWLSIAAKMNGLSPEWGWSAGTGGDGIALNYCHDQPNAQIANDLAFTLETPTVPEPSSVAAVLLGLVTAGMGRMKKWA